jgi:hypothetical protein
VPGGNRAPLGTVRQGRTIEIDEASFAVVRRVYELAAGGLTDREVGAATGLALKHVAEVLTNPFYAGRLWSGEPSALGPLTDPATWEHVQGLRARYSRRHRGGVNRRQYGLGGLPACGACGRHLIGHVGRYRHMDACEPFKAAAPRRIQRDGEAIDPRVRGESYKVEVYEEAIGRAFEHVAVSSTLKATTIAIARRPDPDGGDVLAQARIKREREKAALQFAKDRDLGRLEATMARLDAEATAAVVRPSRLPTAAESRAYLESLPVLWAKTSDAGRKAIAEAVFERIDVLGATDYTFTLTAHAKARGWDAAFGAGVVAVKEGRSGRGERSSPGHLHVGRRTVGSDDVGDAVAPAPGSHLRPGTSRPRREGADSEAPGGNACRGCDNRCSQRSDRRLRPKCEPIPAMSRGIADAPPASSESACIGEELRDTGSTVRDA